MRNKPTPRNAVSSRDDFIKHIQRVEAYVNGANHKDVDSDDLPAHVRNQEAAEYAAALYDAVTEALQRARAEGGRNDKS